MEYQANKDNICVVCFRNIDVYAVGVCNHYDRVCYVCSARLRVLCQKYDCPICRKLLPKVIFSEHKVPYNVLSKSDYPMDSKYKICFENEKVKEMYELLLHHGCGICPQPTILRSFGQLKDHLRKEHELFYCELCVEHLKLFTFERKFYNRKDLAHHRRVGDPDNTSHRGHPRCQFCDQRYLDKDELYRHLRREHFFCHFCDADGYFEFYGNYNYLRDHFQDKHFLCEEDLCKDEKFTSVFRSDIDLKAHVASQHSKNFTKLQAKQARTLELQFTIAPRHYNGGPVYEDRGGRRGRRGQGREARNYGDRERGGYDNAEQVFDNCGQGYYPDLTEPEINTNCEKEFPTLSGQANPNRGPIKDANNKKITIKATSAPKNYRRTYSMSNESDFPSLEPTSGTGGENHASKVTVTTATPNGQPKSSASNTVMFRINNKENSAAKLQAPNLSIQVSSKTNSNLEEENGGWSFAKFVAPKNVEDEFPSLVEPSKKSAAAYRSSCTSRMTIPIADNSAWCKSKKNKIAEKLAKDKKDENFEVVKTKAQKKKQKNAMVVLTKEPKDFAKEKPKKKEITKNTNLMENYLRSSCSSSSESLKQDEDDEVGSTISDSNQFYALSNVGSTEIAIHQKPEPKKNFVKLVADDFPPLAVHENQTKPVMVVIPPGFNKKAATAAIKNKQPPPPGFIESNGSSNQPTISISLSSVARQLTGPSKEKSDDNISTTYETKKTYLTPENFEDRNRLLIQEIWEMLGDDQEHFKEFKRLSGMFRQGALIAREYYEQCLEVFGNDKFHRILTELLVLLPDIGKQQELLAVHNETCKRVAKETGTVPKNSVFMVCASCQQVLSNRDFRNHMFNHKSDAQASNQMTTHITWVKK